MEADAKSGLLTGGAAVPVQRLHVVGAQEIVIGQIHESSGPGRRWRRGCPREREGCECLEEAAGAAGLRWEIRCGRSKGPAEGWWAQRLALWWADLEPPLGKMFFSPVVDTWQAGLPESLCKARGCFSGTKSRAWSLGENCLSDQPDKVAGGANSRLLPLGAREMSKRISCEQLSGRGQESGEHRELS